MRPSTNLILSFSCCPGAVNCSIHSCPISSAQSDFFLFVWAAHAHCPVIPQGGSALPCILCLTLFQHSPYFLESILWSNLAWPALHSQLLQSCCFSLFCTACAVPTKHSSDFPSVSISMNINRAWIRGSLSSLLSLNSARED